MEWSVWHCLVTGSVPVFSAFSPRNAGHVVNAQEMFDKAPWGSSYRIKLVCGKCELESTLQPENEKEFSV